MFTKYRLFCLFLLFFLFIFLIVCWMILYQKQGREGFESRSTSSKCDLVVTRYKENVDYLLEPAFQRFQIYLYNKGDEITNPAIHQTCKVISLPNVGKCDHTYLHHIITHYSDKDSPLASTTVFLPASFYYMDDKKAKGMKVLDHADQTKTSLYPIVAHYPYPLQEDPFLKEFALDHWETSFGSNKDEKNYELLPATTRPFGDWMQKHFPQNKCPFVMYHGIFAASREDILHTSKEKYMELCQEVDHHKNPEAGHYIERVWVALFDPVQPSSIQK